MSNDDTVAKFLVAGLVAASLLLGAKTAEAATTLAAQMETPKSPYQTTDFNLGFVALDINGDPVTVKCFLGGSATPFQTVSLSGGGTSGNCGVNSSVIPGSGTYQFHITATDGSETVISPDVSVEVITGGPGTPTNYHNTKVSECERGIAATTADDGDKTVRVEIYRSTERSYTADASTLVASLAAGSKQPVSFIDAKPDCGKTYYYAMRAFDALGNGSGIVADERTVVRTTGGGTTTVTTPGGAIAAAGGAVAGTTTPGEEGGTVAGEETPGAEEQTAPSEEGQVLGEEQAAVPESFFQKHKNGTIIAILILLALAYYAYNRKGKDKKGGLKPPIDTPKTPSGEPPSPTT